MSIGPLNKGSLALTLEALTRQRSDCLLGAQKMVASSLIKKYNPFKQQTQSEASDSEGPSWGTAQTEGKKAKENKRSLTAANGELAELVQRLNRNELLSSENGPGLTAKPLFKTRPEALVGGEKNEPVIVKRNVRHIRKEKSNDFRVSVPMLACDEMAKDLIYKTTDLGQNKTGEAQFNIRIISSMSLQKTHLQSSANVILVQALRIC